MTNSFNPYAMELQHLEQWLQKDQDLLCQIQDRARVALSPTEKAHLQLDYEQVRRDYEQHLADWERLRQRVGSGAAVTVQAVETQVQENNARLTEVAQQLNAPSAPPAAAGGVATAQSVPAANAPAANAPATNAPAADAPDTNATPRIFVSYAHRNNRWLTVLQTQLAPLVFGAKIEPWDDTKIPTGSLWDAEIKKALDEADIAVLLVTSEFLASRYIVQNELPDLLKDKKLIWIAVSASNYEVTDLARYQCANDPARPLDSLTTAARNREWVRICKKILEAAAHPR